MKNGGIYKIINFKQEQAEQRKCQKSVIVAIVRIQNFKTI